MQIHQSTLLNKEKLIFRNNSVNIYVTIYNGTIPPHMQTSYTRWTTVLDEDLARHVSQSGMKWGLLVTFFPGHTPLQLKNRFYYLGRTNRLPGAGEAKEGRQEAAEEVLVLDVFDWFE